MARPAAPKPRPAVRLTVNEELAILRAIAAGMSQRAAGQSLPRPRRVNVVEQLLQRLRRGGIATPEAYEAALAAGPLPHRAPWQRAARPAAAPKPEPAPRLAPAGSWTANLSRDPDRRDELDRAEEHAARLAKFGLNRPPTADEAAAALAKWYGPPRPVKPPACPDLSSEWRGVAAGPFRFPTAAR